MYLLHFVTVLIIHLNRTFKFGTVGSVLVSFYGSDSTKMTRLNAALAQQHCSKIAFHHEFLMQAANATLIDEPSDRVRIFIFTDTCAGTGIDLILRTLGRHKMPVLI
jgi:hypothetical protein